MKHQRFSKRAIRITVDALLVGCAVALLPGCSDNSDANDNANAEARELARTSREWSHVAGTGNVDAIVSYWTDDAVLMVPGLTTFRGKAAIRQYVEQSMRIPGFRIKWRPVEAHVSGDSGYLIERSSVTAPNAKGALETQEFRVVTIWRKDADGKWRNVVDASVPD